MPADDKSSPWESDGPILISLVVSTDPVNYEDAEIIGDVQELVVEWTDASIVEMRNETGDDELRVFVLSIPIRAKCKHWQRNWNSDLARFGFLDCIVVHQVPFGSRHCICHRLDHTAIAATYGAAGIFGLTFNAAMNSIPILLLAIGVDYGIHVVRIREVLQDMERDDPQGRVTMKDFDTELRLKAIRSGAVLTSAALVIAIFTDMVGFLSFRLSSQMFLGILVQSSLSVSSQFMFSVSLLPALMTALPTKALPLKNQEP